MKMDWFEVSWELQDTVSPAVEQLLEEFPGQAILAGSFFRSLFEASLQGRYDIYLTSPELVDKVTTWMISRGFKPVEKWYHQLVFKLPAVDKDRHGNYRQHAHSAGVYVHTQFFGAPEDLVKQFDFTVEQFSAWKESVKAIDGSHDHWQWQTYMTPEAVLDSQNGVLAYNKFANHDNLANAIIESYELARSGYRPTMETLVQFFSLVSQSPDILDSLRNSHETTGNM